MTESSSGVAHHNEWKANTDVFIKKQTSVFLRSYQSLDEAKVDQLKEKLQIPQLGILRVHTKKEIDHNFVQIY